MSDFAHLHIHTEYSFLDGTCRIVDPNGKPAELLELIANYKVPAVAITDHGNICGAIEFYSACQQLGIKPIIGCEVYLAPNSRFDKKSTKTQETSFHLTLLTKDYNGYLNLLKLTSLAYTEGFYHKPRVDKELLEKYKDGIICLSGCIHGEIPYLLLETQELEKASKLVEQYKHIFGEDFYLEVMDNGMEEQKRLIPLLIQLSKYTSTPLVATNDSHYLKRTDAFAHDVFLCIGTGAKIQDQKRLKFPTDQFYVFTPEEMKKKFSEIPNALKNTLEISSKCDLILDFDKLHLPKFKAEKDLQQLLKELIEEGINKKKMNLTDEVKKRLEYELKVIEEKKLASYFLIVHDIVKFAKENNIAVGPGRGSGAGSIVSYLLDITSVNPMEYGLLFERFLNPARTTLPDLDIDFADEGRDKVIEYVRKKFGQNSVAQIVTFSTLHARMVIRDVGRVFDYPQSERDRLAKLVPFGLTIYQALNSVPELKNLYNSDEKIKKWLDIAMSLEGLKRQISTHAAGIVITDGDITNSTPLMLSKEKGIITGYSDDNLLKLGLLKIDILGLRTLTIIDECQKMIKQRHNPDFNINDIPLDDKKTYKLLQEAKTIGVFHGESAGMRDLLKKLKPENFNEIIALLSLHRPGPIGSGMIDEFIERKHNRKEITYLHPSLEKILKETYGVIVYQEQVMQIAEEIAGFTKSDADILRQAMSKKIPEEIELLEEKFINGCERNGMPKKIAKKIFKDISQFGSYGFNKSHATAYALITYRTAYLKANYPLEFFLALLNSEIKARKTTTKKEEEKKLTTYIKDARKFGIEVKPPNINRSDIFFSIDDTSINFALSGIKNVGESAAEAIVEARKKYGEFKSLQDLILKTSPKVTKRTIDALIKSGALDLLKESPPINIGRIRAELMKELENKKDLTQRALFEYEPLYEVAPWPEHVVLKYEHEMLGSYFSSHPLAQHSEKIKRCSTHSIADLQEDGLKVKVGGVISNIKKVISKSGEKMAKFKLEDLEDEIDVFVPPKVFEIYSREIEIQSIVLVTGITRIDEERKEIVAEEIKDLISIYEDKIYHAKKILIKLKPIGIDDTFLECIRNTLLKAPGDTKVYIKLFFDKRQPIIETNLSVHISKELLDQLEEVIGEDSLEFA